MKCVLIVFGTRPEAIKMAPVIKELVKYPDKFKTVVCVTAQHREMLDQVLKLFDINPDYDLDIMKPGQDLFDVTSNVLYRIKSVLKKEQPDIMLVQGDTTTTMAASLAAFYEKIPVGHIEAGLRTHNKFAPYPEEVNRRMTSVIADFHFAPTENSRLNLINEGISEKKIWVTGNTVIDSLLDVVNILQNDLTIRKEMESQFSFLNPHKRLILVTGHRRENFGEGFENICFALKKIAQRYADVEILYPVHLNPNVQAPVRRVLDNVSNIHLIAPVDYLPFIYLMERAFIIITDSGGVQEEAPSLGKPVLVMREMTERPEAVASGTVRIVGTDPEKIVQEAETLLSDHTIYEEMSKAHNPYGDGNAAFRIVELLLRAI